MASTELGAIARIAREMDTQKLSKTAQAGATVISKDLINDCVRYAGALNLLYLNNPKCGCTTIKYALWLASDALLGRNTFEGNVHDRRVDPFARNVFRLSPRQRGKIAQAVVFSVVRNPFARALSAYVDKVANDPVVWPIFLKRFGLKPTVGKKELSFADFLGLIAVAHDDILDGHFRPQCRNLLLPLAKPVFVGFVENMAAVGAFLESRAIPFRDERMNASRSDEQLGAVYDRRTAVLVRNRFAEDFARFGYSTDLADTRARPEADQLSLRDGGADPLLARIATGKTPEAAVSTRRSASFASFARATDMRKKLRIAKAAFAEEHNWSRLERYANFVRRKSPDRELQEAIYDRMASLRRGYAKAVSNPDIFLDLA
jgi:hypothetical protein